jgi:hypothetical protein
MLLSFRLLVLYRQDQEFKHSGCYTSVTDELIAGCVAYKLTVEAGLLHRSAVLCSCSLCSPEVHRDLFQSLLKLVLVGVGRMGALSSAAVLTKLGGRCFLRDGTGELASAILASSPSRAMLSV